MQKSWSHKAFLIVAGLALFAGALGTLTFSDPVRTTTALLRRGKVRAARGQLTRAIADFSAAIRADPTNPECYRLRGTAYCDSGELEKAIADLGEALRLNPADPLSFNNRGFAFLKNGDLRRSIVDFDTAIRLNTNFDLAYANRGYALEKEGRYSEARRDLSRAVALSPGEGKYYNSLAWLLATCPDTNVRDARKALTLAIKACDLGGWKPWYFVGTLAAAYAACGDFGQAVIYEERALKMDGLTAKDRLEAESMLALYRRRLAYFQPVVKGGG